jgi:hypothetical protein
LKLCRLCGRRPAKYRYRHRVRWERRHDLCFACWRASLDRYRPLPPRVYTASAETVEAA